MLKLSASVNVVFVGLCLVLTSCLLSVCPFLYTTCGLVFWKASFILSLSSRKDWVRMPASGLFQFAAPTSGDWNSLPSHVTSAPSLVIFIQRLKTSLFHLSYLDVILRFSSCFIDDYCYLGHTITPVDDVLYRLTPLCVCVLLRVACSCWSCVVNVTNWCRRSRRLTDARRRWNRSSVHWSRSYSDVCTTRLDSSTTLQCTRYYRRRTEECSLCPWTVVNRTGERKNPTRKTEALQVMPRPAFVRSLIRWDCC